MPVFVFSLDVVEEAGGGLLAHKLDILLVKLNTKGRR